MRCFVVLLFLLFIFFTHHKKITFFFFKWNWNSNHSFLFCPQVDQQLQLCKLTGDELRFQHFSAPTHPTVHVWEEKQVKCSEQKKSRRKHQLLVKNTVQIKIRLKWVKQSYLEAVRCCPSDLSLQIFVIIACQKSWLYFGNMHLTALLC